MTKAKQPDLTLTTTDDSFSISESINLSESPMDPNSQIQHPRFIIHYLDKNKSLKGKEYDSIDDLKKEAFALYKQEQVNDTNAILTYLDNHQKLVLLTSVPDILKNGRYQDLFVKCVSPICGMCANPFGVVDDELLLECSNIKCSQQYCSSCVISVRGLSDQYSFACAVCRKSVLPKRNELIDEHLIWANMAKLYGTQSLLDLNDKSKSLSCRSILVDIELRRVHLQSRLDTLLKKFKPNISMNSMDEYLINDTKEFCQKLANLSEQIEALKKEMAARQTNVSKTLKEYQIAMKNFDVLCDGLLSKITQLSRGEDSSEIDNSEEHRQHIKQLYDINRLKNLPSAENIYSIDKILEDIAFREKCLSSYLKRYKSLFQTNSEDILSLADYLVKVDKSLKVMSGVTQTLNLLHGNFQTMERFIDEYCSLLIDETMPGIPNSRFILLMERLRTRTEKLETVSYFPTTTQLMYEWQNEHEGNGDFKPKVIDLCKTIEKDMEDLFTGNNYIYSVPYKIGVIGDTSAGKSALIMALSSTKQTGATVLSQRSTFGYLQIDTFYEDQENKRIIPFSFIDIEGAIDNQSARCISNYIDIITKTDCDLYMIVFEKPFTDFNQDCRIYVEKTLNRKCLLVRSKVDTLFKQLYKEVSGRQYDKENCDVIELDDTLQLIRARSLITFKDDKLKQVFLTAAGQDNDLKEAKFAQFDLKKLKKKLLKSAVDDCRIERICKLIVLTSKAVINTCFRRGYAVSKTRYRVLAAGASLIPLADEIPAFFGREKIRQAFGIHDKFAVTNVICKTKDSLEEYLMTHQFGVPKDALKSGYFQYLILKDQDSPKATGEFGKRESIEAKPIFDEEKRNSMARKKRLRLQIRGSSIASTGITVAGAALQVVDDIMRTAIPFAAGTLRVASVAGIVVGAVFAPVFAAWAFYNAGNRMNEHLHLLCDDLQTILIHFIVHVCNESCDNIPLPDPISVDEETSSEDED